MTIVITTRGRAARYDNLGEAFAADWPDSAGFHCRDDDGDWRRCPLWQARLIVDEWGRDYLPHFMAMTERERSQVVSRSVEVPL